MRLKNQSFYQAKRAIAVTVLAHFEALHSLQLQRCPSCAFSSLACPYFCVTKSEFRTNFASVFTTFYDENLKYLRSVFPERLSKVIALSLCRFNKGLRALSAEEFLSSLLSSLGRGVHFSNVVIIRSNTQREGG